jgi:hypothetical protein
MQSQRRKETRSVHQTRFLRCAGDGQKTKGGGMMASVGSSAEAAEGNGFDCKEFLIGLKFL